MLNILIVAGARPNFMKVAPILKQVAKHKQMFSAQVVHTGQHYDAEMSDVFFADLELSPPDWSLGVGSGTHAVQTAKVMVEFEKVCLDAHPDLVVVVGDVNSTLACALTAAKLQIPVAHVEAGLRSRDRTMPEEINRIVTDAVSDLLFTTSRDADENLRKESIEPERIHFVGNVMIDSLLAVLSKAEKREVLNRFSLERGCYAIVTLHRPSNVDDPKVFSGILEVLRESSRSLPILWPVHPRARKSLENFGLMERVTRSSKIRLTEPIGYVDMLALCRGARLILTDSGGIQEEATILRVPCITLRDNTERPVTIESGCNQLAGNNPARIRAAICNVLDGSAPEIRTPELWDGHASERIIEVLKSFRSGY